MLPRLGQSDLGSFGRKLGKIVIQTELRSDRDLSLAHLRGIHARRNRKIVLTTAAGRGNIGREIVDYHPWLGPVKDRYRSPLDLKLMQIDDHGRHSSSALSLSTCRLWPKASGTCQVIDIPLSVLVSNKLEIEAVQRQVFDRQYALKKWLDRYGNIDLIDGSEQRCGVGLGEHQIRGSQP